MNYKFYVIFHKNLFKVCYENLNDEQFKKLSFVAVNSKINKEVPERCMNQIISERNLNYYNPLWQHSNFCESSAFLHVYKNQELLDPYDYIGFFQYDMIINPEAFNIVEKANQNNYLFYQYAENSKRHLVQVIGVQGWNIILKIYNTIFNTNHNIEKILEEDIPLYHCYVLPKHIFQKMMSFCETVFPYLFELLGCETIHLPYHLERLHGIFLLCQKLEGHLPHWIHLTNVIHNDSLKDDWQDKKNSSG